MTIDEAKKLLRKDIDDPGSAAIEDVNKAEELGIEALKYLAHLREVGVPGVYADLPGETED